MKTFQNIRIALLSFFLVFVTFDSYLKPMIIADQDNIFQVVVHPLNPLHDKGVDEFIGTLDSSSFDEVSAYITAQAARYDKTIKVSIRKGSNIKANMPIAANINTMFGSIVTSIRIRIFDIIHGLDDRLFEVPVYMALYPIDVDTVPASYAVSKGAIVRLHVFADKIMHQTNNVVMAHELLHILGASDKYDLETTLPIYPMGYAEPYSEELYPQRYAELMGGRIPLTETLAVIPDTLEGTMVGETTAKELNWL